MTIQRDTFTQDSDHRLGTYIRNFGTLYNQSSAYQHGLTAPANVDEFEMPVHYHLRYNRDQPLKNQYYSTVDVSGGASGYAVNGANYAASGTSSRHRSPIRSHSRMSTMNRSPARDRGYDTISEHRRAERQAYMNQYTYDTSYEQNVQREFNLAQSQWRLDETGGTWRLDDKFEEEKSSERRQNIYFTADDQQSRTEILFDPKSISEHKHFFVKLHYCP